MLISLRICKLVGYCLRKCKIFTFVLSNATSGLTQGNIRGHVGQKKREDVPSYYMVMKGDAEREITASSNDVIFIYLKQKYR